MHSKNFQIGSKAVIAGALSARAVSHGTLKATVEMTNKSICGLGKGNDGYEPGLPESHSGFFPPVRQGSQADNADNGYDMWASTC